MLGITTAVVSLMMTVSVNAPEVDCLGTYEVTAYSYHEGGGENYETASGEDPVPYYTVAATKDFAFGEKLYIEGVGEVCVQDRGAFPQGVIDLHIGYDDPVPWGRQERRIWRVVP